MYQRRHQSHRRLHLLQSHHHRFQMLMKKKVMLLESQLPMPLESLLGMHHHRRRL
jgi:hypothetical protein